MTERGLPTNPSATRRAAALLALAILALARPAAAQLTDAWQAKYEGVRHLLRTGTDAAGKQQRYHVALIDLTNPHVKVRTVLNGDKWGGAKEVVSKMAQRHQAVVAVNGDYWGWGTHDPSQGTTAVEGTCYRAHPERSALALSADLKQVEIGRFGTWPIAEGAPDDCPTWVENAIGAGPQFIFAGVDQWQSSQNAKDPGMVDINGDTWFGNEAAAWGTGRNPNTAVGVTQDKKTLILVTCDGRGAGGAAGCRMSSDMVAVMKEFGAHDALKLDSGGSTTFYYDGAVRNVPSDGHERAVVDALVVQSVLRTCDAVLDGKPTTTIDDASPCFTTLDDSWWTIAGGVDGGARYTWATAEPGVEASGRWAFSVTAPGSYRVEAFIPAAVDGLSRQATYQLLSGDGSQLAGVTVDQQAGRGTWISLGAHGFAAGKHGAVVLDDNTGEPLGDGQGRKLVYDAVRLIAELATPPDAGTPASPDAGSPDAAPSPADGAAAATDGTPGPGDAGPLSGDGDASADADGDGDGCALGQAGGPAAPSISLLGLLVALLASRLRRRPRR